MELYIHLPFCKSKCRYCDFNSYACSDESIIFSYLAALNREIHFAADAYKNAKIDTVYIGGGTPSLLEANKLASLLRVLNENFDLSQVREFTIECNPESMTDEKLAVYKNGGINRISVGVQSLDDRNLKSVGRAHDAYNAIEKLKLAKKYFDNISCDVIVGLPYDTNDGVRKEIEALSPLVKHMSVYALTLEDGTPLAKRAEEGKVLLPTDDEVADFLEIANNTLEACGFKRYEISNFAVQGFESVHNCGYWSGEEYIGLGAGAHSYLKTSDGEALLPMPVRFAQPRDLNAYIAGVNCAQAFDMIPRIDMRTLSQKDIWNEKVMLGLRMTKGVDSRLLEDRIPSELKHFFKREDGRIALTRGGMAVMNSILIRILRI